MLLPSSAGAQPQACLTLTDTLAPARLSNPRLRAGDRSPAIPSRIAFMRAPLNVIDCISIVPFYVELVVRAVSPQGAEGASQFGRLAIIRMLRLVRVLRIFKIGKSFRGVVVLMRTLAKSINAILL